MTLAPHSTGSIVGEVTEPLRARLAPLVVLVSTLLAAGAPLAHHVVGARELSSQCGSVAGRAADYRAAISQAQAAIDDGAAERALAKLVQVSNA